MEVTMRPSTWTGGSANDEVFGPSMNNSIYRGRNRVPRFLARATREHPLRGSRASICWHVVRALAFTFSRNAECAAREVPDDRKRKSCVYQ